MKKVIKLVVRFLLRKMFGTNYLFRIINFLRPKIVTINNEDYEYLFHTYNNFATTERCIEIPIIEYFLDRNKCEEILEIGNVSNYYYSRFYERIKQIDVVDKIESGAGIITCDIAHFTPHKKYDFIFSISTFEHMDSDLGRNPDYIKGKAKNGTYAMDNIIYCYDSLLIEGGSFIITALLSYTNEWDDTFFGIEDLSNRFKKINRLIFQRINEHKWRQMNSAEVKILISKKDNLKKNKYLSVLHIKK